MSGSAAPSTSVTLLARLQQAPADQAAWGEFVRRYGPQVYGWCRRWRLQEADAQDVTQQVLLRLADKMRTFAYDPARSFRAWLKTLARHALVEFLEGRTRNPLQQPTGQAAEIIDCVAAHEDLLQRLAEEFDLE